MDWCQPEPIRQLHPYTCRGGWKTMMVLVVEVDEEDTD